MKPITSIMATFIATIVISLPSTAFAEGGYNWEKKQLQKPTLLKTSVATKMGHTASQHKFMMTESQKPSDNNQLDDVHSHIEEHQNHMAVDHKRHKLGQQ